MAFGSMVVIRKASNTDPTDTTPASVLGRAKLAKSKVSYNDEGAYSVDWTADLGPSDTFAELAKIMLLPWYEASMMALLEDPSWNDGIAPENIRPIRRTLLMARDMLDVFSPVFPDTPDPLKVAKRQKKNKPKKKKDRSVWKELRTMYRHGYQLAGELHDLRGLTYSDDLLEERVDAVMEWKREFVDFSKTREIRRYLYQDGIDPNGCYYHEASHLFWAEMTDLPCGNDLGPKSLRALASVQLEHSLGYLDTIEGYTTVMPRKHETNFHNLRKELRIFVDEYNLFGSVLVPDNGSESSEGDGDVGIPLTLRQKIDFLDTAQGKLGDINDKWTAHDLYAQDDSHHTKQEKLAKQTDALWMDFLEWQHRHDLRGVMEEVLQRMNASA